ncbi:hypothetical protein [Desulfobacter sp.]|uniref:hypothetical protein n=1 Tax=Desulfobacter sp. TaxID=2294 RepID=UPI0025803FD0|nr:hypothetical protein [Desulfobacter sp.]
MELLETNGQFTYFIVSCITGKMGMRPFVVLYFLGGGGGGGGAGLVSPLVGG